MRGSAEPKAGIKTNYTKMAKKAGVRKPLVGDPTIVGLTNTIVDIVKKKSYCNRDIVNWANNILESTIYYI